MMLHNLYRNVPMTHTLTLALAAICSGALALAPPAQNPQRPIPPAGQQQAPVGTEQAAPVPLPGREPIRSPLVQPQPPAPPAPGAPVILNFAGALQRAQIYSQDVLAANYAALIARETKVQTRAALLPEAIAFNQFIYTQPNGTPSGVFVSNDGPHVYNQQLIVHGDIYSPQKLAEYRRTMAAEAVARARYDLATRGLMAVVVQDYYGVIAAQRKLAAAGQSVAAAEQFLDITRKLEAGGEAAHADVVKAQLQLDQRRAEAENVRLDLEKARISFAVILFPNYGQLYTLIDDIETTTALPAFREIERMASTNNPEIRAAEATVRQQRYELQASRAALYPALSFDYFYGINANQYAIHNPEGNNLLGSVAQAQLSIPLFTWGATRSRIRESQLRLQQARTELSFTQRQLLANLDAYYREAAASLDLLATLRRSAGLAEESLKLTLLRYQAGEATAFEVVDAETTLVQARTSYIDGLLRYRLALANLQVLTGAF